MPERWFITGATERLGTVLCPLATAAGIEIIASSLSGRHGSLSVYLQNQHGPSKALNSISPDPVNCAREPVNLHLTYGIILLIAGYTHLCNIIISMPRYYGEYFVFSALLHLVSEQNQYINV